jgi:hypothetical protein
LFIFCSSSKCVNWSIAQFINDRLRLLRRKSLLKTGEEKMKTATKTATPKVKKAEDIFQAPKTENLSVIVKALEEAHALIQKETDAPRAVISIGRSAKVHGSFTPWTPWGTKEKDGEKFHEIFISASSFHRGAEAILGTLLHETAHSLDVKAGRVGVSQEGYHNKTFKSTAESLGLEIQQVKRIGWSETKTPASCLKRWEKALNIIAEALKLVAMNDAEKPKGRNKNNKVAVCQCGEKIRLSLKAYNLTRPFCQNCETEFQMEDEGGDE